MAEHEKWLAQLQVGDAVAVFYHSIGYQIQKIVRRTSDGQIMTEDERTYDNYGEEMSGEKWKTTSLSPITPEIVAEVHHKKLALQADNLIHRLTFNTLRRLQDAQLEELIAILKKLVDEKDLTNQ